MNKSAPSSKPETGYSLSGKQRQNLRSIAEGYYEAECFLRFGVSTTPVTSPSPIRRMQRGLSRHLTRVKTMQSSSLSRDDINDRYFVPPIAPYCESPSCYIVTYITACPPSVFTILPVRFVSFKHIKYPSSTSSTCPTLPVAQCEARPFHNSPSSHSPSARYDPTSPCPHLPAALNSP